jgi:hypothetical protein
VLHPASRRRSVGLRWAAAIELQNPPASDIALDLLRRMFDEVNRTGDKLAEVDNDHQKQVRLVDAMFEELYDLAKKPGGSELAPMVTRLQRRVLPWSGPPASGKPCSCGIEGGTPASACLCDLVKISDYVVRRVRELYAHQLPVGGGNLPRPSCSAQCVRRDSQHGYFGVGFAVNALTKVRAKDIVVSVELKPDSLDIAGAVQTLYLLVHETVCHAYQSLNDVNRRNSDDTCAWSDGWMDALAWRLTELWIERDSTQLPAWMADTPEDGKHWCRTFHDRRYAEPRCAHLRPSDMAERTLARRSFHMLCSLWDDALPPGGDIENHRATKFSVLLNHCAVADHDRRLLIAELNTALTRRRARRVDIAGACSDFLDHCDPDKLREDLHTLNNLPTSL